MGYEKNLGSNHNPKYQILYFNLDILFFFSHDSTQKKEVITGKN